MHEHPLDPTVAFAAGSRRAHRRVHQDAVVGALNVYGTKPDAFDDDAVAVARAFAGYAAVALANAHLYDTTASLAHHMQTAMASRRPPQP